MDIQIILIAIVILVMAWALERIVAKTQNLEKHILGLRTRLNNLEKRITSASQSPSAVAQSYYSSSRPRQTSKNVPPTTPKPRNSGVRATSGKNTVICPFCGTEYDADLDRCPKCHHINIEKYKVKKSAPPADTDDFDF